MVHDLSNCLWSSLVIQSCVSLILEREINSHYSPPRVPPDEREMKRRGREGDGLGADAITGAPSSAWCWEGDPDLPTGRLSERR